MWPFKDKMVKSNKPALRQAAKPRIRSYEAASMNRLYPLMPSTQYPNNDIMLAMASLRDQARNLEQNSDVAKRAISLVITNVIGSKGILLKSAVKDKSGLLNRHVNNEIEDNFCKFSQRGLCDTSGRFSWHKIQKLVAVHLFRDGEAFIRHIVGWPHNEFGYAIQIIEPDLIDENLNVNSNEIAYVEGKPRIIMGIELDEYDRHVAFYVKTNSTSSLKGTVQMNGKYYYRVPAAEMTHIYDPKRCSAIRGISEFSAVIERMRSLEKYMEAEVVAARVGASRMGFYKKTTLDPQPYKGDEPAKNGGADGADEDDGEEGASDASYYAGESGSFTTLANPGHFSVIPEGYEFQDWNPDNPNSNFSEFRKSIIQSIAAGLNVGFSELCQDYSSVNYTSLRAAALTDRDTYEMMQGVIVETLCADVYRNWFKASFLKGVFKTVSAENFAQCLDPVFKPRKWKWVDPEKEASSDVMLLDNLLASPQEILAERGSDIEEIYLQLEQAHNLREKLKLSYNKNTDSTAAKKSKNDPNAQEVSTNDEGSG